MLVLGGGGALGAYQAGVLLELARRDILPDAFYGCSAGALNAAFLACDPSVERAEALAGWWSDLGPLRLLSPTPLRRVAGLAAVVSGRRAGLLTDRPLRRLVADLVPAHDVSELAVPLTVTTTCLDCGVARHHRRGPLADVLTASCALPGLFAPVRLADGHAHVDGGIVCGVPLAAALADAGPADRVIVIDCGLAPVTDRPGTCAAGSGSAELPEVCGVGVEVPGRRYVAPVESMRGPLDVLLRAFTAARTAANRSGVAAFLDDPRVTVLPHVADAWVAGHLDTLPSGPRDVRQTSALLDAGVRTTSAWFARAADRTTSQFQGDR